MYAASLGLVDEAYHAADNARLGPDDPRFPRLCARLGLVEFWLATGQWPDCAAEVPYDFEQLCRQAREVAKEPLAF